MFRGEKPLDRIVDFPSEDLVGRLIVHYFFPADFLYRDYCRISRAFAAQKRHTRWRASQLTCYQRLWLASLFTVAEGFLALRLQDEEIGNLLNSEHFDSLRHFRNGTFHYQKQPRKHVQFFLDEGAFSEARLEWAQALHEAFDRFHLEYRSQTISRNIDALAAAWRRKRRGDESN